MKLGISTYSFPWAFGTGNVAPLKPFTYQDLLLIAARKNIKYVQFSDNYPLHLLDEDDLNKLINLAGDLKIKIELGTKGLTDFNVMRYLAIAQSLQCPFIRIVIDDADYRPTQKEVTGILSALVPALRNANVQLLIENHDRFKTETLKQIIEDTDPGWIGICLDTANSLGAGEGIREVVTLLAPYTVNLHIKDFMIVRLKHKMGFRVTGCISGEGMLDVPWLLKEIARHGKCKTATMELWSEPDETIQITRDQEQIRADKSIDYLKTLIP